MASTPQRQAGHAAEPTRIRPEPALPAESELARVEREAEQEMKRSQRTLWLVRLVGLGVWMLLIAWAILGPHLSDRIQVILGLLVAIEVGIMAFLLAIYSRRTQVRTVKRYLDQLRELAQRLQEMSQRDSLTGLYNHGYLLRRLQEETSLARRHKRPLSLVILDLNQFKEINDRHGHLVGDEVLQLIAANIQQEMRQHDIVARYGGDEFCLVLPETERADAEQVVEKLRTAVYALSERLEGWTGGCISFDYGICTYPEDGATVRALIAAADAQLYQEKAAERLKRARAAGTPAATRPA